MLEVIFRTSLIFIFTFIIIRFLGKKRLSQLNITDLLLIISLGSAVGDVMIYNEDTVSLLKSVVAISTVAIIIKIIDELTQRTPVMERIFDGQPSLLIIKGKINQVSLKKEKITEKQLRSLIREQGCESIAEIKYAIFEPDGKISIIRKNNHNRS